MWDGNESLVHRLPGSGDLQRWPGYYDGQAHPVGGITPKLTGGAPPTLEGSGHVGATISPAINVLIYGVDGPKAAVNVGLSLDASVGGDDDPRQCLIGREALVLRPKRGILEGLPDVVGTARPTGLTFLLIANPLRIGWPES